MSLDSRDASLRFLHPAVRNAVEAVLSDLHAANHPFEVFEAYRSPQRQRYLYAKGRTTAGTKVTNASAWSSYHQYGLAADFVLKIDGGWSWKTGGKYAAAWQALHAIGRRHGLEPLSWEMPHLQMTGLKIRDLQNGQYPVGGDITWAENLEAAIIGWDLTGAPPEPDGIGRPGLKGTTEDIGKADGGPAGPRSLEPGESASDVEYVPIGTPGASGAGLIENQFSRIQAYIDKWEGGYSDHPSDPGGPTNMGITQETLARWRGRAVSKEEVQALPRTEQRQIMKAFYYDVIRGDELPAPIAALVYNGSILHGAGRSAQILQEALRHVGAKVAIDGAIGRETLSAVSYVPVEELLNRYVLLEEHLFRSLRHFPTFGKGWLNRLDDIANFARSLIVSVATVSGLTDQEQTDSAGRSAQAAFTALKRGDADPTRVTALQQRLVDLGYSLGKIDGKFGSLTAGALLAFQHDNRIAVTGVLDAATEGALSAGQRRPLDEKRVTATEADLIEQGSRIATDARSSRVLSWAAGIFGALGIGNSAIINAAAPTTTAGSRSLETLFPFLQEVQTLQPNAPADLVNRLVTSARTLSEQLGSQNLPPELVRLLEQIGRVVPEQILNANPDLQRAIETAVGSASSRAPEGMRTIFDVLPTLFADNSVLQTFMEGVAATGASVVPGFGGSVAALALGLAGRHFANRISESRVRDHRSAGNINRLNS